MEGGGYEVKREPERPAGVRNAADMLVFVFDWAVIVDLPQLQHKGSA